MITKEQLHEIFDIIHSDLISESRKQEAIRLIKIFINKDMYSQDARNKAIDQAYRITVGVYNWNTYENDLLR